MYIPKHFQITDTAWCHALMRAQSFAAMITADDAGVPFATHLPILVDPARGPLGTLRGHVARANPHWRYLSAGRPTLVIFAGAHAYVSPSWYATHPSVPTWNYVAVHATGTGALVEDPEPVKTLLADLVRTYESSGPTAWSLEGLPADYLAGMQRGIVAFEIPIERLEGKAKLSQNRDAVDQARTREALAAADDPLARAVAALMAGAPPR
ncbi:MAG TPA: FMN-binding negative transcriptional regulator [Candidatus Dormibacteraeota bacterium]|jgi:transcriptional regulator|nr:FMN-binding negative transcriptional regulator [Candidatus Dormibacteraeota bacterium]